MNNQVEFPEFAGKRAAAINQRLVDYAKAKKAEEKAKESKKAEIKAINEHYNFYINKAKEEQARLKAELQGFIDTDKGETSLSTSLGNIHLTKNTDHWNWPTVAQGKKIAKDLPDELIKKVPDIDKTAIKKLTTVTADGKVIVTETGQLLDWLNVTPGKGNSLTVKLDGSLKPAKKREVSKK
ncbi:hypothetical protein FOL86_02350 [Lactobacillus reuteri]|uniref:host-nuclease inhibitor Gam family protein n=1 Tax=Limosilactobacillus reuteri TaxID=1598 RepID=UPI00146DE072|nr:host-nuclease inhibitor Gam family protein [Limosilactobacillus reuteri]NMV51982.1 hypothetical protein [Limosilactobacillus reuteri]